MTDNTLTLALEGDVLLHQFNETMRRFQNLVNALSQEVAEGFEITWFIDALQGGSALATIIGIADEEEPVQKVVNAYTIIGKSLQYREPIPFSQHVAREAQALTHVIGDRITEIRFITAERDSVIYGVFDEKLASIAPRVSFGGVKGRVQGLNSRRNLKFTVYDSIYDKPVTCFLKEGQEEKMRDIWGKEVIVFGHVTRGIDDGQPKSIRDISSIDTVLDVIPGSYKTARGILNWSEGDEPAEVSIRRVRDAED